MRQISIEDRSEVIRCAQMKFLLGYSLNKIAASIGISRTTVTRRLKEAKNQDIIQTSIKAPHNEELAGKLISMFSFLRDARVASVELPASVKKSFPMYDNFISTSIADVASTYLERKIRSGTSISLDGGKTLAMVMDHLPVSTDKAIKVYPLVGLWPEESVATSPIGITTILCRKYPHPKTFGYHLPDRTIPNESISKIYQDACNAEIIVLGIGSLEKNSTLQSILHKFDINMNNLRGQKIIGSVGYHLIHDDGTPYTSPLPMEKGTAMSLDDLKKASKSKDRVVIAVAGGESKQMSIWAALNGQYINTLLTDSITAAWLIKKAESMSV